MKGFAIGWSLTKRGSAMEMEFWMTAIALALASAGVTGWVVRRSMLPDFDKSRTQMAAAAKEQCASISAKLRAAHTTTTRELEQVRASVCDQIAAAVTAEKAATTRAEGRLKIAYEELDRLRLQANPAPAPAKRDWAHAFAATEAMESR